MWSLESSNIIYYSVFFDMFLSIGQNESSFLVQCVPYVLIGIVYNILILLGKMYNYNHNILSPEKLSHNEYSNCQCS